MLAALKDRRNAQLEAFFVLRPENADLHVERAGELPDQIAHERAGMPVFHVGFDDRQDLALLHRTHGPDDGALDAGKIGRLAGRHERETAFGIAQI